MRRIKSLREQIENRCRHFTGISNGECRAGVRYETMRGPIIPDNGCSWPCFQDEAKVAPKCEKCSWFTEEEIQKQLKDHEEHTNKLMAAMILVPEIKKTYKGKDWKGTRECPVCHGVLHLSHAAYNGHVWGKCETPDCVAWME